VHLIAVLEREDREPTAGYVSIRGDVVVPHEQAPEGLGVTYEQARHHGTDIELGVCGALHCTVRTSAWDVGSV
jgi:hypothetical protein